MGAITNGEGLPPRKCCCVPVSMIGPTPGSKINLLSKVDFVEKG